MGEEFIAMQPDIEVPDVKVLKELDVYKSLYIVDLQMFIPSTKISKSFKYK